MADGVINTGPTAEDIEAAEECAAQLSAWLLKAEYLIDNRLGYDTDTQDTVRRLVKRAHARLEDAATLLGLHFARRNVKVPMLMSVGGDKRGK